MTGCQTQTVQGDYSESVSSGDSAGSESGDVSGDGASVSDATVAVKIDDNGKPIYDFDEFVNGEWLKEREMSGDGVVASYFANNQVVDARVRDILENTDISEMSEDDGLYKAIMIYRELADYEDIAGRMDTVKKYLSEIEKVRTLDDLYKLYARPEYSIYNDLLGISVDADDYGDNMIFLEPHGNEGYVSYLQRIMGYSDDDPSRMAYLSYFEALGYSEEEFTELVDGAVKISGLINQCVSQYDDGYVYTTYPERLEEAGVQVPVFDILDEMGVVLNDECILAPKNVADILGEIYVPENVELLKDYWILYAADNLSGASGFFAELYESAGRDYTSVTVYPIVTARAGDVLTEEYLNRYLADGVYEEMESMFEDIKKAAMSVINDTEWLSVHGQEKARAKFLRMQVSIGSNRYMNDLSDITLTGNAVSDFISLTLSRERHAWSQVLYEGLDRGIYCEDTLITNARYYPAYNAFILDAGLLCDPKCSPDAPYEERLGYVGRTIAHELSHSLDTWGINFDDEGCWIGVDDTWLSEDELAAYGEAIKRIVDFYDGKDGGFRRTISGTGTVNENFADLLAMQICLKLLSQRDNPDYDLFFRTVAEQMTMYLTEDNVDQYVDDEHLTGKLRIDYIFGMFDKFYEIYDIDESSPYYVLEQNRLRVFGAEM
jgi:predicted metalloendopeptidase